MKKIIARRVLVSIPAICFAIYLMVKYAQKDLIFQNATNNLQVALNVTWAYIGWTIPMLLLVSALAFIVEHNEED